MLNFIFFAHALRGEDKGEEEITTLPIAGCL